MAPQPKFASRAPSCPTLPPPPLGAPGSMRVAAEADGGWRRLAFTVMLGASVEAGGDSVAFEGRGSRPLLAGAENEAVLLATFASNWGKRGRPAEEWGLSNSMGMRCVSGGKGGGGEGGGGEGAQRYSVIDLAVA